MGKIHALNSTGDTTLVWDPKSETQTEKARTRFSELRREGNMMTEVVEGKGSSVAFEFNPQAEEYVAHRPLAGG